MQSRMKNGRIYKIMSVQNTKKSLISIIVPVFNEASGIAAFHAELNDALTDQTSYNFEVLYIDDGSTDDTVKALNKMRQSRKKVSTNVLRLSRNFGKEAAVSAGLAEAKGKAAIIIDGDGQHPVEHIEDFIKEWEQGVEVVVGVRQTYSERGWLKRQLSRMFYWLLGRLSDTEIMPHSTDFRLVDREVIDAFNSLSERSRMTRGLIDWLGYDRAYVYFTERERQAGTPSYGYRKLFQLAMNTFVSHSFVPLRFAGFLGLVITVASGLLGMFILVQSIIMDDPLGLDITGTAMLAVMLLFLVGIVLCCLGIMSYYLAAVYTETLARPLYIVRRSKHR